MANKVVQLINEDNDNVYPLAGGMAANSVTTAMLQDDSVTSDKIDWATQTTYSTVQGAENSSVRIFGNICTIIVRVSNKAINNNASLSIFPQGTIPSKFTEQNFSLRYPTFAKGNSSGATPGVPIEIQSNGEVRLFNWGTGDQTFETIAGGVTLLAK